MAEAKQTRSREFHAAPAGNGSALHLGSLTAVVLGALAYCLGDGNGVVGTLLFCAGSILAALTGHAERLARGVRTWLEQPRTVEVRTGQTDYRSPVTHRVWIDGQAREVTRVTVNLPGDTHGKTQVVLETARGLCVAGRFSREEQAVELADALASPLGLDVERRRAEVTLGARSALFVGLAIGCCALVWSAIGAVAPGMPWATEPLWVAAAALAPWLLFHALAAAPSVWMGRRDEATFRAALERAPQPLPEPTSRRGPRARVRAPDEAEAEQNELIERRGRR